MSVLRFKAEWAVGVGLGALFVGLGIYAWIYYFTVSQTMDHTRSIYGNYLVMGLFLIIFGAMLLRVSIPFFLPFKKNNWQNAKSCPYCGVLIAQDAADCQKCQRKLPSEEDTVNSNCEKAEPDVVS